LKEYEFIRYFFAAGSLTSSAAIHIPVFTHRFSNTGHSKVRKCNVLIPAMSVWEVKGLLKKIAPFTRTRQPLGFGMSLRSVALERAPERSASA
jgi:hypothetical protein